MRFNSSDITFELERFSEKEDHSKIEQVMLAQILLNGCIDLLEDAKLGSNTEAYIIDHLKIMASSNHTFLSRDKNLDSVLKELEEEGSEEEQEDLRSNFEGD